MVSTTIALNTLQKLPAIGFSGNPVNVGITPQTIYTVPTGKKAKLTSLFTRLVSLGTGTQITFTLVRSAVNLRLERTTIAETVLTEKLSNTTGIEIDAGDTIVLDGDGAGDNSSVGFSGTVEEYNV